METKRFYNIRQAMETAYADGQLDLAKSLALEYLQLAKSNKGNWNYGNAIHHANLILGRIALQKDDILNAKVYLLKAGNTTGSPQLNSFGPNMALAKELLEKGESKVVVEFINLSKKYWKWYFSWYKTRRWKKEIQRRKIPDFGANIQY